MARYGVIVMALHDSEIHSHAHLHSGRLDFKLCRFYYMEISLEIHIMKGRIHARLL